MIHGRDKAKSAANTIRNLGGSERAALKLDEVAQVHEYMADSPAKVRKALEEQYHNEWSQGSVQSHSDYSPRVECNYENDPENRACWGCSVPSEVYQKFRRQWHEENQDMGSLRENDPQE